MIREVRGARLLRGYRGRPALDVDALVHVIQAVSDLLVQDRDVQEIDLNPVRVYAQGVLTLDVRIRGCASPVVGPAGQASVHSRDRRPRGPAAGRGHCGE